jgi:hypothetical protein
LNETKMNSSRSLPPHRIRTRYVTRRTSGDLDQCLTT